MKTSVLNVIRLVAATLLFSTISIISSFAMQAKPPHLAILNETWNFRIATLKGQIRYMPSSVWVKFNGKEHRGKLRIDGNRICTQYETLLRGRETCFKVFATSDPNVFKTSVGGRLYK